MSTEISDPYLGRWGNKPWKSRRIYVALGHDELSAKLLLPTAISRANDIVFQRCLQFYGSLTILLQVQVLPVAPFTNMV